VTIATQLKCDGCGKSRAEGEPLAAWLTVGPMDGSLPPLHYHNGACFKKHGTTGKALEALGQPAKARRAK
jgi:hypothetical protein